MFHPDIVERRLRKIEDLPIRRLSVEESIERQEALASLWSNDSPVRPLTEDEQRFVLSETTLSANDFEYFATHYAFLTTKTGKVQRISFWESQRIALEHLAEGELNAWKTGGDNLWVWLKARQLGATQVCETIAAHRLFFYPNQRVVIASDKPESSLELSRRVEFIYNKLPWWMKPHRKFHVKGTEMFFDILGSSLIVGHGRREGSGIAQGQWTNVFHLTELPDWENWKQIDEDFLPTVPIHPTSTGFAESTPRGRNDHWHKMFQLAWEGKSRFRAFFIPWYAEGQTYRLTPPEGWKPSSVALSHAAKVEKQSPLYCRGRTIRLPRNQLYWWERTYHEYEAKKDLATFFQEYGSDHMECFQASGRSVFDPAFLGKLRNEAPSFNVYDILSAT